MALATLATSSSQRLELPIHHSIMSRHGFLPDPPNRVDLRQLGHNPSDHDDRLTPLIEFFGERDAECGRRRGREVGMGEEPLGGRGWHGGRVRMGCIVFRDMVVSKVHPSNSQDSSSSARPSLPLAWMVITRIVSRRYFVVTHPSIRLSIRSDVSLPVLLQGDGRFPPSRTGIVYTCTLLTPTKRFTG